MEEQKGSPAFSAGAEQPLGGMFGAGAEAAGLC